MIYLLYLIRRCSIAIIYMYIIKTACVAQLAKASDTQSVGRGFEPRPEH